MAREYEGYRPLMEQLNERFPKDDSLTKRQAADFLGYKDTRSVNKFPFGDMKRIPKSTFAREICRRAANG